jgi:hypothetical protein
VSLSTSSSFRLALYLPSSSALCSAANPPCSVGAGVSRLHRAFIAAPSTVLARAPTPAGPRCIISSTGLACLFPSQTHVPSLCFYDHTTRRSPGAIVKHGRSTSDPCTWDLNDVDYTWASPPSPSSISIIFSFAPPQLHDVAMSGYYSGHNIPPQYYNVDPNALPNTNIQHGGPPIMMPQGSFAPGLPDNPFHSGAPGPFVQYAEPHMPPTYVDQFDDASGPLGSAQGANARARRRPVPGEQVKHRRTRSGCFTCRQRRVKVNTQ